MTELSSPISKKNAQLIETQLMQILASPYFKSAKQLQKFLNYIVRKTLKNQEKQLTQYTIAVEGLAMPEDFDSVNNPVIRIVAGRVRERLDKYYQNKEGNDPLLISISKGSYVPIFIKKDSLHVSNTVKTGLSHGPKLALVCFSDKTQNKISNRLLFQISDTLAQEFSLFLFSQLVVSIPHADKSESNRVEQEMKAKHNANFTLALYMQQLPDKQYKLLYRLFSTDSEEVICSESFDINGEKPIKDQQKILNKIVSEMIDLQQGALHISWARNLLKNPESIPKELQVLAYYQYQSEHFSRDSFRKAVSVCEEMLNNNKDDVIANIIYADYCRQQFVYGYDIIDSPLEKGRDCAEKATFLQPNSHEAHYALGQILFNMGEKESALIEFYKAKNISKYHSIITFGIGYHLCMMDKWDEGMTLVNEVINTSNTHPDWYFTLPFLNEYRQKNYQQALGYANRIFTPFIFWGPLAKTACYGQLGETDKAKKELKELLKRFPNFSTKGKPMLKRFLGYEKTLLDKVWQGIIKAGLK